MMHLPLAYLWGFMNISAGLVLEEKFDIVIPAM
jgi:hypothetical protein